MRHQIVMVVQTPGNVLLAPPRHDLNVGHPALRQPGVHVVRLPVAVDDVGAGAFAPLAEGEEQLLHLLGVELWGFRFINLSAIAIGADPGELFLLLLKRLFEILVVQNHLFHGRRGLLAFLRLLFLPRVELLVAG